LHEQIYEISVQGSLDEAWQVWFDEMEIARESDDITLLRGVLQDQSALHGVLNHLLNLNLKLISVTSCCPIDPAG